MKLKPCPFCGGKAECYSDKAYHLEEEEYITKTMCFVVCTECSALVSGNSMESAIDAWNRRTYDE